jgi:hypothetical protein
LWPTPSASVANDGEKPDTWLARAEKLKAKKMNGNGAGMPLTIAVQMWPTPTKSDGMGGPGCSGREGGKNLRTVVRLPTPASRDYRSPNKNGNMADQLPNVVGGQLNADWVEILMGFPRGWTDIGATDGKTELQESQQDKKIE